MTEDGNNEKSENNALLKGTPLLGYYGARKQRTSLSLQTKLEVIKFAEHNPSVTQNKIASHFGIDRTTVSKVLKRREIFKTSNPDDRQSDSSCSPAESRPTSCKLNHRVKHELKGNPITSRLSPTRRDGESSRLAVALPFLQQPNHHLYEKCESWFLKQKFTTLSKKYEKDIIAYSVLVNPLPIGIEACDKIILAKFLLDHAVQWLYRQIRCSHSAGKGMELFEGKGDEIIMKYINEESKNVLEKVEAVFRSHQITSEEILRVWKHYVGPKFNLFDDYARTETFKQHLGVRDVLYPVFSLSKPSSPSTISSVPAPGSPSSVHSNCGSQHLPLDPVILQTDVKALDLSVAGDSRPLNDRVILVKGSRKRKMNSNPVRIIASEEEEQHSAQHASLWQASTCSHNNSFRPVPVVSESYMHRSMLPSHTLPYQIIPQLKESRDTVGPPIIEIIPHGFGNKNLAEQCLVEREAHNGWQLKRDAADPDCDRTESLQDFSNNNRYLSVASTKAILRNMSTIARQVKNLKDKFTNAAPNEQETCNCNNTCNFALNERVSSLEANFELMNEKIDKLLETVINKK